MARSMMNDFFHGHTINDVLSHACRVTIVTVKCEQAVQANCGTTVRVQIWHVGGLYVYTPVDCPSAKRLPER